MVGGVIRHHEAGFRTPGIVQIEVCVPVSGKFDLPYKLEETLSPGLLDMLKRAYSYSGKDFDSMLVTYQQELEFLGLRYDAYSTNFRDSTDDPKKNKFGTLHWPKRAEDMFRLGLFIELAKDPDLNSELVRRALLDEDHTINLRSILRQSRAFERLGKFDTDHQSKMTPLDHIVGVMKAMDLEVCIPETDGQFWKEARFWTHLLHDLTKAFGAKSPLHATLGRDFVRTFFLV